MKNELHKNTRELIDQLITAKSVMYIGNDLFKFKNIMTTEEKAKKYDELMLTIEEMIIMYTKALDKYPSLTPTIQEKLKVLELLSL